MCEKKITTRVTLLILISDLLKSVCIDVKVESKFSKEKKGMKQLLFISKINKFHSGTSSSNYERKIITRLNRLAPATRNANAE